MEKAKNQTPTCLEEILNILGSKKPFLKEPIVNEDTRYPFSVAGGKAYGKLTDIIYGLAEMDVITNDVANDIVEQLDAISNEFF